MSTTPQCFELHRTFQLTNVTNTSLVDDGFISSTKVVADGVVFEEECVVLRWRGKFPFVRVFHNHGMESVEDLYLQDGSNTTIVWLDRP